MPHIFRSRFGTLCKKQSDRFYEGLYSLLGGTEQQSASLRNTTATDHTTVADVSTVSRTSAAVPTANNAAQAISIDSCGSNFAADTITPVDVAVLAAQVHKYRVHAQLLAEENERLTTENTSLATTNTFLVDVLAVIMPTPYSLTDAIDESAHYRFSVSHDILGLPSVTPPSNAENVREQTPVTDVTTTAAAANTFSSNLSATQEILDLPAAHSSCAAEEVSEPSALVNTATSTTTWTAYSPIAILDTLSASNFSVTQNILGLPAPASLASEQAYKPNTPLAAASTIYTKLETPAVEQSPPTSPPRTFVWNGPSALPALHVQKRPRAFSSSSNITTDSVSPPSSSVFSFSSAPSGGSGHRSQTENPFTRARDEAERGLQQAHETARAGEAEAPEPEERAVPVEELDAETEAKDESGDGAEDEAEIEAGDEAEVEGVEAKAPRSRSGSRVPRGSLKTTTKTKKLNAAEKKMKLRRAAGKVEPVGLRRRSSAQ